MAMMVECRQCRFGFVPDGERCCDDNHEVPLMCDAHPREEAVAANPDGIGMCIDCAEADAVATDPRHPDHVHELVLAGPALAIDHAYCQGCTTRLGAVRHGYICAGCQQYRLCDECHAESIAPRYFVEYFSEGRDTWVTFKPEAESLADAQSTMRYASSLRPRCSFRIIESEASHAA